MPHAQPADPSVTHVEFAPNRTIAGLPATCFTIIALRDEREPREGCCSLDGVLLYVGGGGLVDGAIDMVEMTSVTTASRDDVVLLARRAVIERGVRRATPRRVNRT